MNPSNQGQGFFGIKVSKPGVNVTQANPNNLIYQSDYSSTIYYDKNNSRIVEGLLPDGNYGMWVSKPGVEVNSPTAGISGNLVFNSNASFTVLLSGTHTFPSITVGATTTTSQSIALPHGASFVPAFETYITTYVGFSDYPVPQNSNVFVPLYFGLNLNYTGTSNATMWNSIDGTALYLYISYNNGSGSPKTYDPASMQYLVYTAAI